MRQLYSDILTIVFLSSYYKELKKHKIKKYAFLLNYTIDTIIKLCYYNLINREQTTRSPSREKEGKSMSREERITRVIELLNSYDENIQVAEECGISAEELWNTLYRPHIQAIMEENK